ncbi:hypothetical protein [Roseivivax sp. CAU 1761]
MIDILYSILEDGGDLRGFLSHLAASFEALGARQGLQENTPHALSSHSSRMVT